MAAGTSPSVGYLRDTGGYSIAFQNPAAELWTYLIGTASWVNTKLGMAANTSPSMTVW